MKVWNSLVIGALLPYLIIITTSVAFVIIRDSDRRRRVRVLALLRWGNFDLFGVLRKLFLSKSRRAIFLLLSLKWARAAALVATRVKGGDRQDRLDDWKQVMRTSRNLLRVAPLVVLSAVLNMLATLLPALAVCVLLAPFAPHDLLGAMGRIGPTGAALGAILGIYILSHLHSPNSQMLKLRNVARANGSVRVGLLDRAITNLFYLRVLDVLVPQAVLLTLLTAPATYAEFVTPPEPPGTPAHDPPWLIPAILVLAVASAYLGRRIVARRMATFRALEAVLQYTAFVDDPGRSTYGFFGPTPDACGHARPKLGRLAVRLDRVANSYAPAVARQGVPHPVSVVIRAAAREVRHYLRSSNSLCGVDYQRVSDHLDLLAICLTGSKGPNGLVALGVDLTAFGAQGEPDKDLLSPTTGRLATTAQRVASTLDSIERPARVTKAVATALLIILALWLYVRNQDLPTLMTRLK